MGIEFNIGQACILPKTASEIDAGDVSSEAEVGVGDAQPNFYRDFSYSGFAFVRECAGWSDDEMRSLRPGHPGTAHITPGTLMVVRRGLANAREKRPNDLAAIEALEWFSASMETALGAHSLPVIRNI